jgi:Cu/Ag efflux protein CusF
MYPGAGGKEMLKTIAIVLSLSLAGLMPASQAFAAQDKAAKAEKTSLSHVKGDVVSVDQNAKTLTVKKGGLRHKEMTFRVDDPALLANVQTGQSVRVGYVKEGKQMIAKEVVPGTTASRK